MIVTFDLNGGLARVDTPPDRRLLDILHVELRVFGPKAGCGIGRCGACLVLMDGRPVNACLVLIAKMDGAKVVTIEGLTERSVAVRRALAEAGAVQCGFCAPGLVTLLTWLSERRLPVTADEAQDWMAGQICRCTGYGGLRRALETLFGTSG